MKTSKASPLEFIKLSVRDMLAVQEANVSIWHLNDPTSRWDVDLEAGKIMFTFPEKTVAAEVQIVGTLLGGEFMWSWNNPTIPESLSRASIKAKRWGVDNNIAEYTKETVPADMDKAWEFTAVAARLDDANGTYSGESGNMRVFMTFGPVTMVGNKR